jgi:hypothetical protein
MPSSNQTTKDCIKSNKENIERAKKSFAHLSDIQLNWKPNSESWSVGECLSHLVISNRLYLDKIENILDSFPTGSKKDFPYKQSFLGKLIAKGVDPSNLKKAKTFKVFFPASSNIQKNIIDEYVKSSEKLIELMGKMQHLDLKKIKLSSPVNILIRQNLGDPLIIIPLHDERHLNQAKRVMSQKGFPKGDQQ